MIKRHKNMYNMVYYWPARRFQPHQVVTPSVMLSGYNTEVAGRPSARLFAESLDANRMILDQWLGGGVVLDGLYNAKELSADFVMPEGATFMRFGVWADPEAFAKGIVTFHYLYDLKVHPLVAGHLLDTSLAYPPLV